MHFDESIYFEISALFDNLILLVRRLSAILIDVLL